MKKCIKAIAAVGVCIIGLSSLAAQAATVCTPTDSGYTFKTTVSGSNGNTAIIGIYDTNKKLINVSVQKISGNEIVNEMRKTDSDSFARVFVWDSLENIKPKLLQTETIELTAPKPKENVLTVGAREFYLGMNAGELPAPEDKVRSTYGGEWYVYGTGDYTDFAAAHVINGAVNVLISAGENFSYSGENASMYTDKNDGGRIHGIMVRKNADTTDFIAEALAGESKINFHCANAFRAMHGKAPFAWSEAAATSARLHSEDMAANNYFNHTSLDGRKAWDRMKAQGINYKGAAENISAGRSTGFRAYDGWVNSEGHRNNMLGDFDNMGVGAGYNKGSTYGFYFTQNFYTEW